MVFFGPCLGRKVPAIGGFACTLLDLRTRGEIRVGESRKERVEKVECSVERRETREESVEESRVE